MFYLFHGPNSLARDEELGKMKAKLGEPDIASLNTTLLDKTAQIKDLMAAADTMPFLSDKRLVIAQNLIAALGAPKGRKAKGREAKGVESTERVERTPLQQLIEYLPTMSDTTRLIFAEDETLAPNHPLV